MIHAGAIKCKHCGEFLSGAPKTQRPTPPVPTAVPPSISKPIIHKRTRPTGLIVGLVLAFLAILFVVLTANRTSLSPVTLTGAVGLGKKVNTLNGSYSTGPIYPAPKSNLYGTVRIQDPPYTLSLDFSDDGTVFSARSGHVLVRGTYEMNGQKIRFVWGDPKLPAEEDAEMHGNVIFWKNYRYERK
jgi:hypothetical protein